MRSYTSALAVKFLASAGIVALTAGVLPAMAQVSSSSTSSAATSSSVSSSAVLPCLAAAVDTRESALISARVSFNAKIVAALEARRVALKAAFQITDNGQRQAAIRAAWNVFVKASADARAQYQVDVKAAWSAYLIAAKKCNPNPVKKVKDEAKDDEKKALKLIRKAAKEMDDEMHGKAHLEQEMRAEIHGDAKVNGYGINANGGVNADLKFSR